MKQDFKSDGCTLFPDLNYKGCCVAHDIAYQVGGTRWDRLAADNDLRRCVAKKGHPFIAWIMWVGVRIGGVGWLPTPWRFNLRK